MMNFLGPLLSALIKPLSVFFGALYMKHQGKKEAILEGEANALEESKKALKDKNAVGNLDANDLSDIVFLHPNDNNNNDK